MIHIGNCLHVMPTMEADSVDSIVTDPPYGLGFMGKEWDHGVPGVEFWKEALRVAKPGAHLVAFGGTRTFHRLVCAIEDAGWEIRDSLMWVYGSGFPKSLDVSKAIDKAAGEKRSEGKTGGAGPFADTGRCTQCGLPYFSGSPCQCPRLDLVAVTDAARQWNGWGTALKPAWEPIILARKPLSGTVAANVQAHGTGGLNIAGCRIGSDGGTKAVNRSIKENGRVDRYDATGNGARNEIETIDAGRWPANVIHDGSAEVVSLFPDASGQQGPISSTARSPKTSGIYGKMNREGEASAERRYAESGGTNFAPLPGQRRNDAGSAARFFYCAKASKKDREHGLEGFEATERVNGNKWTDQDYRVTNGERPANAESGPRKNIHPTVKPTDLMRWLVRLVTPPGGLVLDPFTGSGSTGKAAIAEGMEFVGIELSPEYAAIAEARCKAQQPGLAVA